jgi:hypothetical protein
VSPKPMDGREATMHRRAPRGRELSSVLTSLRIHKSSLDIQMDQDEIAAVVGDPVVVGGIPEVVPVGYPAMPFTAPIAVLIMIPGVAIIAIPMPIVAIAFPMPALAIASIPMPISAISSIPMSISAIASIPMSISAIAFPMPALAIASIPMPISAIRVSSAPTVAVVMLIGRRGAGGDQE